MFLCNLQLSGISVNASSFSKNLSARSNISSYAVKVCSLSTSASASVAETLQEYERDQLYDEEKTTEKDKTLNIALSQLAPDFDRASNLSLNKFNRTRYMPVISTGSLKLDLALGIGGLPKGRIVEIYGREASGKTTLALHIIKEAQKQGGCCAYLDAENALNHSFAEGMGVNTKDLLIVHPNSAENSLSIVDTLVNSGSVDVIVVDSVAALVPQSELAGVIDINTKEVQSKLVNQALRKLHASLNRSQTLVIFINQTRANLRSSAGLEPLNEVTCGGNALKFYSAMRLRIKRKNLVHQEDEITGVSISVQIMKNKLAPAMKTADLEIEFGRGFRVEAELLKMACEHGLVMREGDGFWINGKFFDNRLDAENFIASDNGVSDELIAELRIRLFNMKAKD